eukprot:3933409-Rhodomonas_salina.2
MAIAGIVPSIGQMMSEPGHGADIEFQVEATSWASTPTQSPSSMTIQARVSTTQVPRSIKPFAWAEMYVRHLPSLPCCQTTADTRPPRKQSLRQALSNPPCTSSIKVVRSNPDTAYGTARSATPAHERDCGRGRSKVSSALSAVTLSLCDV